VNKQSINKKEKMKSATIVCVVLFVSICLIFTAQATPVTVAGVQKIDDSNVADDTVQELGKATRQKRTWMSDYTWWYDYNSWYNTYYGRK
jgi:hypothetical protein